MWGLEVGICKNSRRPVLGYTKSHSILKLDIQNSLFHTRIYKLGIYENPEREIRRSPIRFLKPEFPSRNTAHFEETTTVEPDEVGFT